MSIQGFGYSISHAWHGLKVVFKSERNFRIQILMALAVVGLAIYFPLRAWEVILLILLAILVLVMELLNTAIEYFADLLKPRLHHYVLLVKDIMAAAVFLTAVGSAIIGIIIFLPHFINLLK